MNPKKVLIIRFSSIGDIVLTAPAIARLHEAWPDAEIHLLTKKAFLPLWRGDRRVRARAFDPEGAHFGLPGLLRFLGELEEEGYDWIIDLHGTPKSRALAAVLGVPMSRYDKASLARRLYVRTKRFPGEPVHVARRYVRALAPLGIETEGPLDARIPAAGRDLQSVKNTLGAVGIQGRNLIAIVPGSQWATKQWGLDRYTELVDRLNARGFWVGIVGSKAERDDCERIAEGRRALNFAGLYDLGETLALLHHCGLVVSNDSGPMHMASAAGCDVIALFGSTTPPLGFAPLAARHTVLQVDELTCRPCSPHGRAACPQGHLRCMRDLTVDRVWAEVERYLGPPPPPDSAPAEDEGIFHLGSLSD